MPRCLKPSIKGALLFSEVTDNNIVFSPSSNRRYTSRSGSTLANEQHGDVLRLFKDTHYATTAVPAHLEPGCSKGKKIPTEKHA
jgi:hypothetical protein